MKDATQQAEGVDLEAIRRRLQSCEGGLLDITTGLAKDAAYHMVDEDVPALLAEVQRLRAEPRAGQEWRDISEAPRDGYVLTWNGLGIHSEFFFEGAWGDGEFHSMPQPTHYQPLPPPPQEKPPCR